MKILIATPIYPPEIGGPATYTKELCKHLAGKHEITIIAYTDEKVPFPGTKLLAVSKKQPLLFRLFRFFYEVKISAQTSDIIYVQNAMAAGLPVALASMISGTPFVLKFVGDEAWERATQHRLTKKKLEEFMENPEGGLKIKLMMAIQGFVLRQARVVTTPSAYLLKAIVKTYKIKPDRAIVNYNAAESGETIPFESKRIKHQIATTARLVAWKGIDGIIKATAILKKTIPTVRLVVAGDGPEMENLKNLTRNLNIEKSVVFLGNVSRAETWQLRKNSEVYVLNSTYEGLPHTVLTSFAAEIPTVATNIPGTNEALYHEKTGLLVEPGNEEELARAIERFFKDPELGKQLAQNGLKLLKEKFSWEAHVKTLNDILRSAVTKPSN